MPFGFWLLRLDDDGRRELIGTLLRLRWIDKKISVRAVIGKCFGCERFINLCLGLGRSICGDYDFVARSK